jgi:hypothetical protein
LIAATGVRALGMPQSSKDLLERMTDEPLWHYCDCRDRICFAKGHGSDGQFHATGLDYGDKSAM